MGRARTVGRVVIAGLAVLLALVGPLPSRAQGLAPKSLAARTARCDAGDAEACRRVALHYYFDSKGSQHEAAARYADKACMGRDALGCALLGELCKEGLGVPKSARNAVMHFREACALGDPGGCEGLWQILHLGADGVPANQAQAAGANERAANLYEAGCAANDAEKCWALAHRTRGSDSHKPQLELFKKACSLGSSDACVEAGRLLDPLVYADNGEWADIGRSAEAARPFYAKAQKLFRAECRDGSANACDWLGLMARAGMGVPRSGATAISYYSRACELGRTSGCGQVAWIYEQGEGVRKSPARAVAWREKACDLGDDTECVSAGFDLEEGGKFPLNPARAAELYQKACDRDESSGCFRLCQLVRIGRGVPRDPERATALCRKLQSLGSPRGCEPAFDEKDPDPTKVSCD
jgi:TPR repeat protein